MTSPVLLVGSVAEHLAPRLRLSGYEPLRLGDATVGCPDSTALQAVDPAGDDHAAAAAGGSAEAHGDASTIAACRADAPPPVAVILSPGEEPRIGSLRQRWGAVPILLGIPEDSVDGRALTLLSGADDFWLPGLAPSDLLTRLRLHCRIASRRPQLPERLQVADLQLNLSTGQVQRGSRPLSLTAREYQLLLLLLEHRGRVLNREQILATVWPDQQGAGSNVIEVYVRYLRQKLEQGGERRLIHTVRGRGYCLSDGPPLP